MKTTCSLLLLAALSTAGVLLSGCGKADGGQPVTETTKATAKEVAADVKDTAFESWDTIKDYTYEKRDAFATTLSRLSAKLDAAVGAANATVPNPTEAAVVQREAALKKFNEARSYLETLLANVHTGTSDTWDNSKAKVAQAWQDLQAAAEKLKQSPPS